MDRHRDVVSREMNDHSQTRYWVNIVTHDHVRKGAAGGFAQADHGSDTKLKALAKGDFVVFYSPRTSFRNGKPLQEFTALAVVEDDKPYQVEAGGAQPWRRKLGFLTSQWAPIAPLVNELSFIPDKEKWGLPFSKGLFEIDQSDFTTIAKAMGVESDLDPAPK